MQRHKILAVAALVVATSVAVPTVFARGGPAEKATGFVTLYEPWDGGHRDVDFNAHEAYASRPAKGEMVDYVYGPDDNLRRVFKYDVKYVNVEGPDARFGAYCWYDSQGVKGGDWLYVKVEDGGTPGANGDGMGWLWGSETEVAGWVAGGGATGWWRTPIAGNLVVHTN